MTIMLRPIVRLSHNLESIIPEHFYRTLFVDANRLTCYYLQEKANTIPARRIEGITHGGYRDSPTRKIDNCATSTKMEKSMRLGAYQFAVTGSIQENLSKIKDAVCRSAESGVRLLVFPECAL